MDYDDTSIELPPIHRVCRRVVLDAQNTMTYDYVKKVTRQVYDQVLNGAAAYAGVLKLLTRLRQTCIAPYLMLPESKRYQSTAAPDTVIDAVDTAIRAVKEDHFVNSEDAALQKFFTGQLHDWVHDRTGTAGMKSPKITAVLDIVDSVIRADGNDKIVIFSMFNSALGNIFLCAARDDGCHFLKKCVQIWCVMHCCYNSQLWLLFKWTVTCLIGNGKHC
jgi:SNF2 family DNA or RNA helicase